MKVDDLAVMQLIDLALDTPQYTYPMHKNAPRPVAVDYAAVRLVQTVSLGKDQTDIVERDGTTYQVATGIRVLHYEVMFTRDDEEVQTVQNAMVRPDILEWMETSGYAVLTCNPIAVETLTLETNWEVRSGLTIELNVLRTKEVEINTIAELSIAGEFNEGERVRPLNTIIKET